MKTTKTLLMATVFAIMSISAFANIPSVFQTDAFAKLKYRALTPPSALLVQLDIHDLGANGTFDGIYPLHNYDLISYITDVATPGYANRITIPGSSGYLSTNTTLIITNDDPNYSNSGLPIGVNIFSGTDHSNIVISPATHYIAGANLRITGSNSSTTPTGYSGIPITVDNTPNYF